MFLILYIIKIALPADSLLVIVHQEVHFFGHFVVLLNWRRRTSLQVCSATAKRVLAASFLPPQRVVVHSTASSRSRCAELRRSESARAEHYICGDRSSGR